MNSSADFDIFIVGAATAGLTLAACLLNTDLRIALLTRSDKVTMEGKTPKAPSDFLRMTALTLSSKQLFQNLDIWNKLDPKQTCDFQRIEAWEFGHRASGISFDGVEVGQSDLGVIVNDSELKNTLYEQVKTKKEIAWFFSSSLVNIRNETDLVRLTLDSGKTFTTYLLVGADGADSSVREQIGIQTESFNYGQQALVATVQTEFAHQQTARQIFFETGSLAFLPLSDPFFSSIVWAVPSQEAQRLERLNESLFCEALGAAFEYSLGSVEAVSPRAVFSLKSLRAKHYVKPGIALIGDAVHVVHPLAGQGANLGIADAKDLATRLTTAYYKQRSVGALYTLRPYERARRFHNNLMAQRIDEIRSFFESTHPIIRKARRCGLRFLNKTHFLKNCLTRYAIGLTVLPG